MRIPNAVATSNGVKFGGLIFFSWNPQFVIEPEVSTTHRVSVRVPSFLASSSRTFHWASRTVSLPYFILTTISCGKSCFALTFASPLSSFTFQSRKVSGCFVQRLSLGVTLRRDGTLLKSISSHSLLHMYRSTMSMYFLSGDVNTVRYIFLEIFIFPQSILTTPNSWSSLSFLWEPI